MNELKEYNKLDISKILIGNKLDLEEKREVKKKKLNISLKKLDVNILSAQPKPEKILKKL